MLQHLADVYPGLLVPVEQDPQQVPALLAEPGLGAGRQNCSNDLAVFLPGNVTTDHVVQEDAETPDGGGAGPVPPGRDPLGRRVHPRACKGKRERR